MKPKTLVVDAYNNVAKVYRNGRCYAVRYAKHMTAAEITNELIANPPPKNEWEPFDESTGTFIN